MEIINNLFFKTATYFKLLWKEIKKSFQKPDNPIKLTCQETKKELKSKNKNELFNIIINLVSERDGSIPMLDQRKEMKKQYSKNQMITGIMAMLSEKYLKGDINVTGNNKRKTRKTQSTN